jgi:hypothetical protein
MRAAVSFQIYDDFQILATSAAWRFLVLYHTRGEKNPVPAPQTGVVLPYRMCLNPSALVLVKLAELST